MSDIKQVGEGAWFIEELGVTIRLKPLSDYTQNKENPVHHSPRNFGTVLTSIQKFGALRSGFSSKGRILAGNLTYEAMAEAGIEYVIEIESNGQAWLMHERPDLTDEQQRLAAYFDQQSSFQAIWDAEQVVADFDGGKLAIDGLFYNSEIDALREDMEQVGKELELAEETEEEEQNIDVPDAVWPTDNDWGVPVLDMNYMVKDLVNPVAAWGSLGRKRKFTGTYHFYVEDYRFNALWAEPSTIITSGCKYAVEPNFSAGDQAARASVLWGVFQKRWLARYWQSYGISMMVDMNVWPWFQDLNLLGIPQGWRAYATRGADTQGGAEARLGQYQAACERAGTDQILFVVFGGQKGTQEQCNKYGWVWVREHIESAKGKG